MTGPRLQAPRPRPQNDDERVLPLINVVFLLLIFFMVAGRLAASDQFAIEPPASSSDGQPSRELLVLVGTDGRLAVDGEMLNRSELQQAVSDHLQETESGRVRVKADGRVAATRVVAVMEQLRAAGAEQLDLMTVPEG